MGQMKIYLSIDLDFWNQGSHSYPHMKRFLREAISYVPRKRLFVVDSHEKLISSVNRSGCDTLINIDWHSDLSNRLDPSFKDNPEYNKVNCGSWASFIKWRKDGIYTWIHPYEVRWRSERGYCHAPLRPENNPFLHPQLSGWMFAHQKRNKHPEKIIPWSFVHSVGIAFSYYWLSDTYGNLTRVASKVIGFKPLEEKNPKIS